MKNIFKKSRISILKCVPVLFLALILSFSSMPVSAYSDTSGLSVLNENNKQEETVETATETASETETMTETETVTEMETATETEEESAEEETKVAVQQEPTTDSVRPLPRAAEDRINYSLIRDRNFNNSISNGANIITDKMYVPSGYTGYIRTLIGPQTNIVYDFTSATGSVFCTLQDKWKKGQSEELHVTALYDKAVYYNNEWLDMKVTALDWDATYKNETAKKAQLRFGQSGKIFMRSCDWVEMEYAFFKTGTNTPVTVKGYTTFWDLDITQGVVLKQGFKNDVYMDKIAESRMSYAKLSTGYKYFYSRYGDNQAETDFPEEAFAVSTLFEGASFKLVYTFDCKRDSAGNYIEGNGQAWVAPGSDKLIPGPIDTRKSVVKQGTTSNTLKERAEKYEYIVDVNVPYESTNTFYNKFILRDNIDTGLAIDTGQVRVLNEAGANKTGLFDIGYSGNNVSFTAKVATVKDQSFYGHTYSFYIPVSIKDSTDLRKYWDASKDMAKILNVATLECDGIDGGRKNTNETQTYVREILKDGSIVITKVDVESKEKLTGAVFELFEWSAAANSYKSSAYNTLREDPDDKGVFMSSARLSYSNDNKGRYKVVETKPPTGYVNSGWSKEFTLDGTANQKITYTVDNKMITGSVEIQKNGTDGKALQGVVFELKHEKGIQTAKATTNEKGYVKVDNLKYGKWTMKEEKGHLNYFKTTQDLSFSITKQDEVISFTGGKTVMNTLMEPEIAVKKLAERTTLNEKGEKVPGFYKRQGTVIYDIFIENTGNTLVQDLIVDDRISEELKALIKTGSETFVIQESYTTTKGKPAKVKLNSPTNVTIEQLEVGDSLHLKFQLEIAEDAESLELLNNKVVVSGKYPNDPDDPGKKEDIPEKPEDDDDIKIITPLVAVAKLADRTLGAGELLDGRYEGEKITGIYTKGNKFTYKITVTNTGNVKLYNLNVTDTMEDKLKDLTTNSGFVFKDEDNRELTTENGNKTQVSAEYDKKVGSYVVLSELAVGDSVELTYEATFKENASYMEKLDNVVAVDGKYQEDQPNGEDDDAEKAEIPEKDAMKDNDKVQLANPHLVVAKLADRTTGVELVDGKYVGTKNGGNYSAGEKAVFTITGTNDGNMPAYDVTFTDELDEAFRKVIVGGTGEFVLAPNDNTSALTDNYVMEELIKDLNTFLANSDLDKEMKSKIQKAAYKAQAELRAESVEENTEKDSELETTTDTETETGTDTKKETDVLSSGVQEESDTSGLNAAIKKIHEAIPEDVKYDAAAVATAIKDAFNENLVNLNKADKDGKYTILSANGNILKVTLKGNQAIVDELPAGDAVVLNYVVTFNEDITAIDKLTNTVTVDGKYQPDPNKPGEFEKIPEDKDDDTVSLNCPKLVITKKADKTAGVTFNKETGLYDGVKNPATYGASGNLGYVITVKNIGSATAHNIRIKDIMEERLIQYVDNPAFDIGNGKLKTANGKEVSATLVSNTEVLVDSLEAGDIVEVFFIAKIKDKVEVKDNLNNTATASADNAPEVVDNDVIHLTAEPEKDIENPKPDETKPGEPKPGESKTIVKTIERIIEKATNSTYKPQSVIAPKTGLTSNTLLYLILAAVAILAGITGFIVYRKRLKK